MSRRSRLWWLTALLASVAGTMYGRLLPESFSYGYFGFASCPGHDATSEISAVLWPVAAWVPLFWYGGGPVVVLAFAVHWLASWLGRPWIGRLFAWISAVALVLVAGSGPVAVAVDLVLDRGCLDVWGGLEGVAYLTGWQVGPAAAALCMLAAVRNPRYLVRRTLRARWFRRGLAVSAALGLLAFAPVSDFVPGPVGKCGDSRDPEQVFLCTMHQRGLFTKVGDHLALAYGRRQCAAFPAPGIDPYLIASICPPAAEVARRERAAEQAEIQAEDARSQKICDANRHRPRVRPVRVAHDRIFTDYGVIEALETEDWDDDLLTTAQDDGLVATGPGHLMILTHSDYENCVTVEAYRQRPPLEKKGWDRVVEVGYASPSGTIELGDAMGGPQMPNMAFAGKGTYRIRVHYREPAWEEFTPQHLLIQIFPGRRGQRAVHHD
ncbi:hypothetical protein [Nonomuraea angiospora]|uniref:hypothetical protein n=1 Tax=Nonomuraea angiospora TaxID=46172 RepID=UPI0029B864AE|nr:hypothetical protein [Nonomuraea angiospora]MDX3111079.1 hypothetical protein [Nonomuraea angiospora]